MLRDYIDDLRKKGCPMTEDIGACKFCGQMQTISIPQGDEIDINEAATELCDCFESGEYTHRKWLKENVHTKIDMLFDDEELEEDVMGLIRSFAEPIVDNKITAATLDLGKGTKFKISKNIKGSIKIQRTNAKAKSLEVG